MHLFKRSSRTGAEASSVKNTNTDYSTLYQIGAVACYFLVALPFCAMFTLPFFAQWYVQVFLLVLFLSCGLAGYGLQMLGARLFHLERKQKVFTYEDTTRRYRFEQAIAVHIGTVVIFLLSMRLGWALLFSFGSYYDEFSIVPYTVAVFCAVMTELGGYLWFIPYNTLISMRRIGTVGVALLINFLISFSQNLHLPLFTVLNLSALLLTITLFVLLLNQAFITRPYGGKIARGINDEAKRYSARIVGLAIACISGATVVTMACISAVVSLWYAIVKFVLARSVAQSTADDEAVREILEQDLAGEVLKLPRGQADYWVAVFAVLIVICVVVIYILATPGIKEKLRELWAYLKEVFFFLFQPHSAWRKQRARQEYLNFVDTVEQTNASTGRQRRPADNIKTYTDFIHQLDALSTNDDKIRYAYAVAAAQLRHQRCGVGLSDTPREIARKVKEHGLVDDIDRLTADFERIQYENGPLEHSGTVTLERLCILVRSYL